MRASCTDLLSSMVTRSERRSGSPSLNHVSVGAGEAMASQNRSTVAPSFWMRKLGDTSASAGGAATAENTD